MAGSDRTAALDSLREQAALRRAGPGIADRLIAAIDDVYSGHETYTPHGHR